MQKIISGFLTFVLVFTIVLTPYTDISFAQTTDTTDPTTEEETSSPEPSVEGEETDSDPTPDPSTEEETTTSSTSTSTDPGGDDGSAGGDTTEETPEEPSPSTISCDFFTATPSSIATGDSATLLWSSTGATSAVIDQGIGPVPLDGNVIVAPTITTTYIATFSDGAKTSSCSTAVFVDEEPTDPTDPGDTSDPTDNTDPNDGTSELAELNLFITVINDDGRTLTASDFTLLLDGEHITVPVNESGYQLFLAPGTYVVGEDSDHRYTASYSGDCDSVGSVTLATNDVKACTVTFDDIEDNSDVVLSPVIRTDATGGDCAVLGSWDQVTNTCSLAGDRLVEQVTLASDGITLDGSGYQLAAASCDIDTPKQSLIQGDGRSHITIQNVGLASCDYALEINGGENWNIGEVDFIDMYSSQESVNPGGVALYNVDGVTLLNNNFHVPRNYAVLMSNVSDLVVEGNKITESRDNLAMYVLGLSDDYQISSNQVVITDAQTDGASISLRSSGVGASQGNIYGNDFEGVQFNGIDLANAVLENNHLQGVTLLRSNSNVVRNNRIEDTNGANVGVWTRAGQFDVITDNIISGVGSGVVVDGYTTLVARNQITDITGVGIGIGQYSNGVHNNQLSQVGTGIRVEGSGAHELRGNEIREIAESGIELRGTGASNVFNTTVNNSERAVDVHSDGNIVDGFLASGNTYGIYFNEGSRNNTLINGTIQNSSQTGLYISSRIDSGAETINNTLRQNNFINNALPPVYFINNDNPFRATPELTLGTEGGGNYWSRYDSNTEGCTDVDANGVCDDPFFLDTPEEGLAQDLLPYRTRDGWGLVSETILAPSDLRVEVEEVVTLNWTDRSINEVGFRVFRSIDGEEYTSVGEVGENVTFYEDALLGSVSQCYYIEAFTATGNTADSQSRCIYFDQPESEPDAFTGGVTNITSTSATLNGAIDPNGFETQYFFTYGETETSQAATASAEVGSLDDPVLVSTPISGLSPNTTYSYRMIGVTEDGSSEGVYLSFTTSDEESPEPEPEPEIEGCTNPEAENYNPNATEDDGSCVYEEPKPEPSTKYSSGDTVRTIFQCDDQNDWNNRDYYSTSFSNCLLREGPGIEYNRIYVSPFGKPPLGGVVEEHSDNGVFSGVDYWWYVSFDRFDAGWVPESVIVQNTAPENAHITASKSLLERGEYVQFDATATDLDDDPLSFYWDGEPSYSNPQIPTPRILMYWNQVGTKNIEALALDPYGLSTTANTSVSVDKKWYQSSEMPVTVNNIGSEELDRIISELDLRAWYDPDEPLTNEYDRKRLAAVLFKPYDPSMPEYTNVQRVLTRLADLEYIERVLSGDTSVTPSENMEDYYGSLYSGIILETTTLNLSEIGKIGHNLSYLLPNTGEWLAGIATGLGMTISAVSQIKQMYDVGAGLGDGMSWVYQEVPTIETWRQANISKALRWYLDNRADGDSHADAWKDVIEMKFLVIEDEDDTLPAVNTVFYEWGEEYSWCLESQSIGTSVERCREFYTAVLREELIESYRQYQYNPLYAEVRIESPGYLQIIDDQGRIVGPFENGEIAHEIPGVFYDEETHTSTIYNFSHEYTYRIVGTEFGTYGFAIVTDAIGFESEFYLEKVATAPGSVHDFSENEESQVILKTDSDGNGVYERVDIELGELPEDNIAANSYHNLLGQSVGIKKFLDQVSIELNAVDNEGGSGVAYIRYTIDGEVWHKYTEPVTLSAEGVFDIQYQAVDLAGNTEETKNTSFEIVSAYGLLESARDALHNSSFSNRKLATDSNRINNHLEQALSAQFWVGRNEIRRNGGQQVLTQLENAIRSLRIILDEQGSYKKMPISDADRLFFKQLNSELMLAQEILASDE